MIRYADFAPRLPRPTTPNTGWLLGCCPIPRRYEQFWLHSRAGIVNWNKQLTGAASTAPFGGVGRPVTTAPAPITRLEPDYCAYPVASLEADSLSLPTATLTPGVSL